MLPLLHKALVIVIGAVLLAACTTGKVERSKKPFRPQGRDTETPVRQKTANQPFSKRKSDLDQLKKNLISSFQDLALSRAKERLKDYPLFLTHRIDTSSRVSLGKAEDLAPPYQWRLVRKDGKPEREYWKNGQVVNYYRDSWRITVQPDGTLSVSNKPELLRTDYLHKKIQKPKLF